ncbi:MAG: ABC transporter permease [Bacteroidales bacterium]|nr:ABC transporter permease [Bacteroidales bacterium]
MYIKNFITLLRRYTTSSLLNVVGMAVAFAAIYLILVQVNHDLSFNKVIPNSENIYRMELPDWYEEGRWSEYWNRQTPDELCSSVPEIEAAGTIITYPVPEEYLTYDYSIKRNQTIDNIRIKLSQAEREGLEVFPFEFIEGGLDDFLSEGDFIISEEVAMKFGLKVGDILNLGRGLATDQTHKIVGVFKNFPKPSNIAVCEGWACMEPQDEAPNSNWGYSFYVRLKDGMCPDEVTKKMISQFDESLRKVGYSEEEMQWYIERVTPRLNPLSELYFAEDISSSGFKGSRSTTRTLMVIAFLILIISFINFINFFFALIPTRIKAINTYKVFGAPTSKLRFNIMFETLGLILLSILGAMFLVFAFAQTPLSEYISCSVSLRENWELALSMILFLMAFAAIVSLYPAFYITKFNPALVMKGSFHASKSGKVLRYTLVGIQYVISISLIICSLFIQKQHKHMLKYEMGFDKEMLYTIEVPHSALGTTIEMDYTKRDALTDRLKQNPNIIDVTYGDGEFVNFVHMGWGRDYKGQTINFMSYPVSWNFLQMMGIKIEEGRDFMQSDEQLLTGAYIFNREAADRFGIDLETQIKAHTNELTPVVGICENFNFQPLQYGIEPFAFIVFGQYGWRHPNHAYIRVTAGADFKELSKYIKDIISEFAPYVSVEQNELKFFDDELAIQYQIEDKLSTLVTIFSFLSIIISIIGVFGLVLFETQYKRHEIGIRRIHGASSAGIIKMFNKKYLYIVAICSAVAIPISYYIIDRWMQQFTYRTEMSVWVYVVAVLTITIITIVTVTLRSWKAANENPVDAL